jgi:glycosyltransferase involved in cell wall biosynthesis
VVPAYNEGRVIGNVIADLSSAFPHVVVDDDGS